MNDLAMLREVALGIAVLEHEGLGAQALIASDIVTTSIEDALDLLIHPKRLLASPGRSMSWDPMLAPEVVPGTNLPRAREVPVRRAQRSGAPTSSVRAERQGHAQAPLP
jgi:hypothetical protein